VLTEVNLRLFKLLFIIFQVDLRSLPEACLCLISTLKFEQAVNSSVDGIVTFYNSESLAGNVFASLLKRLSAKVVIHLLIVAFNHEGTHRIKHIALVSFQQRESGKIDHFLRSEKLNQIQFFGRSRGCLL